MKPGLYLCVGGVCVCVCVYVYLVVLCGVSGIIIFEEMEKKKCFGCRIMFCQKF